MLLHAIDQWPDTISIFLRPYAMRHAAHMRNATPFKHETKSPLELFTRVDVRPNICFTHTFGCPVYTLHNMLQAQKQIPTWLPRSRLGIYLGLFKQHARSVLLVLNLHTGLVSPQFHVTQDDFFESIPRHERHVSNKIWMVLAGLKGGKDQARTRHKQLQLIKQVTPRMSRLHQKLKKQEQLRLQ